MECIRPETCCKISATKKSSKSITDVTVAAFNGAILMRGCRSSRLDVVSSLREQSVNLWGATQFTSQIHANVFVRRVTRAAMGGEPAIDELERRVFTGKGGTI